MNVSLGTEALCAYLANQVSSFFPDARVTGSAYRPFVEPALERLDYCLSGINGKYSADARGGTAFNHRNTDQYAMFLYFVSNEVYRRQGDPALADKSYALNKALHGLDAFYEVALPDIFGFQHPVGTVLGRARYSNYFFVYQRCSTGAKDRVYPEIGEGVVMYGGSSIIGNARIGSNVWLSTGTLIMGESIPGDSVVFGQSPNLTIKPTQRDVLGQFFKRRPASEPR